MTSKPSMEEMALSWAIRVQSPEFRDWDGLIAWLAGDPERNRVYNDATTIVVEASADRRGETAPAGPEGATVGAWTETPARSRLTPWMRRRRWIPAIGGMAIAAGIAGALWIGRSPEMPAFRVIETPAGQARTIALADGSRIAVAGGSRLYLHPDRPREVRLERGRAVFIVRHDDRAPFHVIAGQHRIVDIGTSFEVARQATSTRVAVAEGRVIVDPARIALPLEPGEAVELSVDRPPALSRVSPGSIGQWRFDQMSYRGAPLSQVAADLSAALGQAIVVDAGLRTRRFDGTITPATLRGRPGEVAALLDVRVVAKAEAWELHAR